MTVRTRFAPSPTGSLHVGGARTALYSLLYARRHGGRFLLRIEDTDQARSSEQAAEGILRDLRWLGLDWDEGPGRDAGTGPYFQAQRLDIYDGYFDALLASDHAYKAYDSTEELTAARDAASADKRNFRYVRPHPAPGQVAAWEAEGRVPVLRLAAPDHDVHVHDVILGTVTQTADELDDIVIRKADGFPTYHFAVVIDDHLMGVTLVLRGQEHLMNTHKHLGLYEALGWTPPDHGHLPLIFNPGGSKMSKRDKAKTARAAARDAGKLRPAPDDWQWLADASGRPLDDIVAFVKKQHDDVATAEAVAGALGIDLPMIEVMDFRKAGYLPEALLNYLALLGWSPGHDREILSMEELISTFELERVNKTAARFDVEKLSWMNAEYIRATPMDRLLAVHDTYLEVAPASPFRGMDPARREAFLALYKARMVTLRDLDRQTGFFFAAPTAWDDKAVDKWLRKGDGLARLALVHRLLAGVSDWTPAHLDATLEGWCAAQDVGLGKVAQPIRVAVTGTAVSPGIGDTLALLGQEETLRRIDACLAAHAG